MSEELRGIVEEVIEHDEKLVAGLRARIAALESSLRERDERLKALEGALRRVKNQIVDGWPEGLKYDSDRSQAQADTRWMLYRWADEFVKSALSPAPAAKEVPRG